MTQTEIAMLEEIDTEIVMGWHSLNRWRQDRKSKDSHHYYTDWDTYCTVKINSIKDHLWTLFSLRRIGKEGK